ncbi:MAG: hypothetical protein EP330_18980 [Deltaproteobacteria bacterium]|nr:MAG: hypothetical protein EP330_18980 [Deltaproteobacteria bacterium]
MNKKIAAVVAVAALSLAALFGWWKRPLEPVDGPRIEATPTAKSPGWTVRHEATPAEVEAEPTRLDDPEPHTPHEEALHAAIAYSGEGWVRCVLPVDLPSIDVDRLNWAGRDGRVLTMAATESEGTVELLPANAPPAPEPPKFDYAVFEDLPEVEQLALAEEFQAASDQYQDEMDAWNAKWRTPVAFATWDHAVPGELGNCGVEPADRRVPVVVTVVDAEGTPVVDASVSVRWSGRAQTDADGRAHAEAFQGVGTTVFAMHTSSDGESFVSRMGNETVVLGPQGGAVTVTIAEPERDERELRELVDETLDAAEDDWGQVLDPLEQALETDGLSDGARAQLEQWRRRSLTRQDEAMSRMEDILKHIDEQEAAE